MDKAQQEAEDALKAWDDDVTEVGEPEVKTSTPTGASAIIGSTGRQKPWEKQVEAERERFEPRASSSTPQSVYSSTTPSTTRRPTRKFNFGEWVSSCIGCSLFMLIPDIWVSVWIRAIVISGTAPFSFKFYFILSGILGVMGGTIMSLWNMSFWDI
ncbi:MAG TPA: hypothetical protein VMR75_01835 [Candidatus Saccharimonadales bacterium]|nr:hypothetical protein [Candidatus Saccharimonadales bacterium]